MYRRNDQQEILITLSSNARHFFAYFIILEMNEEETVNVRIERGNSQQWQF
jgi:hypothetical protein